MNRILIIIFSIFLVLGCVGESKEDKKFQKELAQYESKHSKEIFNFVKETYPKLNNKIDTIKSELKKSYQKIKHLENLRNIYPRQVAIIDKALTQWKGLYNELIFQYDDIYSQVEKIYISHQINEIEGHENFKKYSKNLLNIADEALQNAQDTKKIIEKGLHHE